MRHDSVQNLRPNLQVNNNLAQGSPSLGFFNNEFSEILHSPVVRSGQGDRPAMKLDGRKNHDPFAVSTGFETDKDDSTNHNIATSESWMNGIVARKGLLKEQPESPSVERLTTQKDLHVGNSNSKVAFAQIPPEINCSPKCLASPSQTRIQHPGLADILSSPPSNKDHNDDKGQPQSSSTTYNQPTISTIFSKPGSSPQFQGSPDKPRPDESMSPKSSPARQPMSDLRQKEVQHPHESPKRQLQQTPTLTPTPTSRSAHLQNLLSDHHGGESLSLTSSKPIIPSSSTVLSPHSKAYTTTSSVPDGITAPLELMPHNNNKKAGQSNISHPEVLISTGGPSQAEELASRKIMPPSFVDSKPSGNGMPHYRAPTPLRESTSTRHQHSVSLPVSLVPSVNVPSADGHLRPATHPSLNHHSTDQPSQPSTKSGHTRPSGSRTLAPSISHAASSSQETILMTPSSLAHSVMLKPTISRQSVTPSTSSQAARKDTGIFGMFRSKTPAQPPHQYEIWHPNTSSKTAGPGVAASGTVPSSATFPEQKTGVPTPAPVVSVPIAIERISHKSKVFTPFRYLTTKRNRAVSMVSVEAQDGTAVSLFFGRNIKLDAELHLLAQYCRGLPNSIYAQPSSISTTSDSGSYASHKGMEE